MENSKVVCTMCKQGNVDENECVTCKYCFSSFHFKCKNISVKSIHYLRKVGYFCTPHCAELFKRIIERQELKSPMKTLVSAELKSAVSNIVNEMNTVKGDVYSITTAIEKSQDFLSSKFDIIVAELNKLKSENENLKQQVVELQNSQMILKSTANKVECAITKADNDAIANNAIVFGFPTKPNENVHELIHKTAEVIGTRLSDNSIASATRLYSSRKPNAIVPIRVKFNSKTEKESMLLRTKKVKELKSTSIDKSLVVNGQPTSIVIRNELTSSTIQLLKELRGMQQKYNVKYIWPGKNGDILIKKAENSKPLVIKSRLDFERAIRKTC